MDSSPLDLLLLSAGDNDVGEDDELLPLILAVTVIYASNDNHRQSIRQLCRSHSDSAYPATMGLNVAAFQAILDAGFSH